MRFLGIAAAGLGVVLLAGCPLANPARMSLGGLVENEATGEPVSEAAVIVLRHDDVEGQTRESARVETDAEGRFLVEFGVSLDRRLRTKGITLRIEADGYRTFTEDKPNSVVSPGTRLENDGTKTYLLKPVN